MKNLLLLSLLIASLNFVNYNVYGARGYWCSVTKTCPSGGKVSCNGNDKCERGTDSVTCDGKTTTCGGGGSNER